MNQTFSLFIGRKQIASNLTQGQAESQFGFFKNNGDTRVRLVPTKEDHINHALGTPMRMPKGYLMDQFFDYAGKGENQNIWLIDAFGMKGGRNPEGYYVPLKMKEYDLFTGREYGHTERVAKYINILTDHADTAMGMKHSGRHIDSHYRQRMVEQIVLGFVRSEDESREWLGIFKFQTDLYNAILLSHACNTKMVVDMNRKEVWMGE